MPHNEDSRVKIPALLHFTRLGYEYLSLKKAEADEAISQNSQLLKNEEFAERELLRLAITQFNKTHDFGFDAASLKDINKTILKEYLDEASGKVPA